MTSEQASSDEQPPAWFLKLHNIYDQNISIIRDTLADTLKKFTSHLLDYEKLKFTTIPTLRAEIAASLSNRDDSLLDQCEVRISNIPFACTQSPLNIATSVLTSINCSSLCNQVIDARIWNPNTTIDPNNSTRSIVCQFNSPLSRNKAMRHAARLRDLTTKDVLGIDGSPRLFMNELYPKPVYTLYRKACNRARELQFLRPLVRGLRVYMRKSLESELIPILTENDLLSLRSNFSISQAPISTPNQIHQQSPNTVDTENPQLTPVNRNNHCLQQTSTPNQNSHTNRNRKQSNSKPKSRRRKK